MAEWDLAGPAGRGFEMGFNARMAGRKQAVDQDELALRKKEYALRAAKEGLTPEPGADPGVVDLAARMAKGQSAETNLKGAQAAEAQAQAVHLAKDKTFNDSAYKAARLKELGISIDALKKSDHYLWPLSSGERARLNSYQSEYDSLVAGDKTAGIVPPPLGARMALPAGAMPPAATLAGQIATIKAARAAKR